MPVSRRALLGAGALGLGAAALGGPFATSAAAASRPSAGTLLPDAFRKLPPAVSPPAAGSPDS